MVVMVMMMVITHTWEGFLDNVIVINDDDDGDGDGDDG